MFKDAISKLRSEMDKNTNNPYIQVVGGFLLQHLEVSPESAEKITATDKTIGKSLDEMRKAAEKKKVGNCAVLTDAEGFAVVLKYFGIKAPANAAVPATPAPTPIQVPAHTSADFNVSLDDLL